MKRTAIALLERDDRPTHELGLSGFAAGARRTPVGGRGGIYRMATGRHSRQISNLVGEAGQPARHEI
jgi:hypothetical protein